MQFMRPGYETTLCRGPVLQWRKDLSVAADAGKDRYESVMSERFVVVPVGQGDEAPAVNDDQPVDGGAAEGNDADQPDAVPILEYSREPNKYGKTVELHYYSAGELDT
ncbi:hypothetical protein AAFF_G00092710 [Aldrovandia affinis]|uniref:Uncharacterized protein n=1 Tax=Aldrovandia affinis TaxID=143900 RepID=A0AAD7T316_9TELE|nr:hypothetical protein AAFF_G00092710 [Aldrovandia affinis]